MNEQQNKVFDPSNFPIYELETNYIDEVEVESTEDVSLKPEKESDNNLGVTPNNGPTKVSPAESVKVPQNEPEKKSFFARNHLIIKAVIIAFLTLLLLIPKEMINSLVSDRKSTSIESGLEVWGKWGNNQIVVGPVLSVINNTKRYNSATIQILPNALNIVSDIKTQTLKRGMYDAVVYTTEVTLSGNFTLPDDLLKDGKLAIDTAAYVNIGLSDLRGLSRQVELKWGNETRSMTSGTMECNIVSTGVNTPIALQSFITNGNDIKFEVKLYFNGSNSLYFAPLGEQTTVNISSNYPTPSFGGAFLPQTREVGESNFKAAWSILSLNRDYPQSFVGDYSSEVHNSIFGVNLMTAVDQYLQVERTIKYAFLIIILTFVLSFFIEVIQKRNIHPLQYLLIGLTLCIFYSLLISISEHFGFDWAYLIASIMTIALITLYMMGVLKIKKTAFTIGGVLACLYTYIYVMIQMETYALLTGSIGLFVIMATIMYFSLRIKWDNK